MNPYLLILLILISVTFALDTLSDYLNFSRLNDPLPKEFEGIYEEDSYRKALAYQKEGTIFGLIQRTFSFLVFLIFLLVGGFGIIDQLVKGFGYSDSVTGLLFLGTLAALSFFLSLPFSIYDTFVLEEKYGFNRTTPPVFITDILKGLLLSTLLGITVVLGIIYFFENTGPWGWLYAWISITAFQLAVSYLAPVFIMPLFNKFSPLADGSLKDAIASYAKKRDFKLSGVYTMDSSKRSTKTNAFFTGFGKFRRLVLFDNLIEKHTTEELVAVVAHEVGHFERKHIPKSMILSLVPTAVLFYTLGFVLSLARASMSEPGFSGELTSPFSGLAFFRAFGVEYPSVYTALVFVGLFFSPIMRLLSVFIQKISRKYEYEADEFSVATYGKPQELISALKKLSKDNLSHLTPHRLKVILDYTHPPVLERIKVLENALNLEPSKKYNEEARNHTDKSHLENKA